jgi:hypothetical protein
VDIEDAITRIATKKNENTSVDLVDIFGLKKPKDIRIRSQLILLQISGYFCVL